MEIALSTTEAEYIALSHSMRETLPMLEFLKEVHEAITIPKVPSNGTMQCTVFEIMRDA